MLKKLKRQVKSFFGNSIAFSHQEQNSQVEQIQIANQYRLMKKSLTPVEMPTFRDVGFKVYSQFEEDGILLYIFSLIGTTNKRVVEICAGEGIQCMAANLIINHGWDALLVEGDTELTERGITFFASNPLTWIHPPTFKQAWITRENINQIITENGFVGEIDLLSLDIDGNDYHIMEAINTIKPRLIICETHNVIPSDLALTIPYKSDFNRMDGLHPDFMGVSLLAMKKLLNKKGYRLIGSNRFGFNTFFMLNGVGTEYFPEVSVESVHNNSYTRFRNVTAWKDVKDLPWIIV